MRSHEPFVLADDAKAAGVAQDQNLIADNEHMEASLSDLILDLG
jgi:hypothetical protein